MAALPFAKKSDTPLAGAAWRDVSPVDAQFLYGYPHVPRMSTGVHDPLLASALYLDDGDSAALLIAVDVIFLSKQQVAEARRQICGAVTIAPEAILISATHTHSGPVTIQMVSNAEDHVVPPPDPKYVKRLVDGIVEAGIAAVHSRRPAELACSVQRVVGLGTNRHDPSGPSCPDVPVLVVRAADTQAPMAVMYVCAMHPTVLHEDSRLVSGDFPGLAREALRRELDAPDLCVLHHMGAAGNQSPRHVVRANTLAEAVRLGKLLADALHAAVGGAEWLVDWNIRSETASVGLPRRAFPSEAEAEAGVSNAAARLASLRASGGDRADVRTAECDWFGTQETLALARAQATDRLKAAAEACLPAEIQLISVGPWVYIGWPGEVFVEYALEVRRRFPCAQVITLANGDLQGYLVTPDAVAGRVYEASNALFASPDAPRLLADQTMRMLEQLSARPSRKARP